MKTMKGSGEVLDVTAPSGGMTSGVGVLIGAALFGIAVTTRLQGELGSIRRKGEFDHAAATHATDQAWAIGDILYWDNTAKVVTKTSSGNTKCGIATAVKASTTAIGTFALVPSI